MADSDQGFINGQLYADDLVDHSMLHAIDLLTDFDMRIAAAMRAATSYADLRARLFVLFEELDVEPMVSLVFSTTVLAELAGRVAAQEDIDASPEE